MAFIKLNDLEVEVEDGTNIVEAARQHGIEVPSLLLSSGAEPSCELPNVSR